MVDWGRIALGAVTAGGSELAGYDNTKNFLFGGDATKGIDAQPKQYDYATGQLRDIVGSAQGRLAPTITGAQLDPAMLGQSRAGMYDTAGRLTGIAQGTAPGAGEIAVNRQVGQATAAQQAAARAAHGANSALAFRNAARNTMDIGLAGAGQAAQAQAIDQQAANAQLAQLYAQAYGLDTSVAGQNAQLQQQAAIQNQQAQLTQTQLNDARQIQALGQMLGWDQARINAELAKAGIAATDKGVMPGLLQAGGQIAGAYATGGASMAAGGAGGGGGGGSLAAQYPHGGSGPVTMPS
jgi:hypothetical protein